MTRIETDAEVLTRVLWNVSPGDADAIERVVQGRIDQAVHSRTVAMNAALSRIAGIPVDGADPCPDTVEGMRALALECLGPDPEPAKAAR